MGGDRDRDDRLARLEARRVRAEQELPDRDVPRTGERADVHRRVEREERHRKLGGRVGVGQASAERAAHPDRDVPDVPCGLGEHALGTVGRLAGKVLVPYERPEAEARPPSARGVASEVSASMSTRWVGRRMR